MKNELDTLDDLFGKNTDVFTKNDVVKAMKVFANQFRYIKTTCGKDIEFDDFDYDVLREKNVFFANDTKCVMAVWKSKNGKKTVAPVAKLLLDCEGKSIIKYLDGNPLNLKRDNLEIIDHQKAHYKQRKQKIHNGVKPTSIYKGVSWSKFANKWSAYIKVDFKKKHLGYFINEEDAARAYNKAAIENWGKDYSELNVIKEIIKPANLVIKLNPVAEEKLDFISRSGFRKKFPNEKPSLEWTGAVLDLLDEIGR